MSETTKLKKPCKTCPFRKSIPPGTLGGSPVEVYIGQIEGPFYLPCHADYKNRDPHEKTLEIQQCAGAAIMRTHVGVAPRMPPALHSLPASEEVFGSHAEFTSHHTGQPLGLVLHLLTPELVNFYARRAIKNQRVKILMQPKESHGPDPEKSDTGIQDR